MDENLNNIDSELVASIVDKAVADACAPLYEQNSRLHIRIKELEAELVVRKYKETQS